MKTKLIFMVMLIVCFSCGTNDKPVSDAQKEKIKGEVKEVVNTFIKGIEEANADMVTESFLDSPDFVDITNGMTFTYEDVMAMKPNFDAILNQKCTMVKEKYTFLDKSTVLYTTETKWSTNYKDGHSSVTDPQAFLIAFKKIDKKWRIIYLVDSNVEKNVPVNTSKELNQVELMKQFIGTWKNIENDTTFIWECKSFGNALEFTIKTETKGKLTTDAKSLLGYDKENDRLIETVIDPTSPEIYLCPSWFTSMNSFTQILWKDVNNPEQADFKWIVEFKSPDSFVITEIRNNLEGKPHTYLRRK